MTFEICKRPCKYRSSNRSTHGCDYCFLTGKLRGCPVGAACTRFEMGERVREKTQLPPPEPVPEEDKDTYRYIAEQQRRLNRTDSTRLINRSK